MNVNEKTNRLTYFVDNDSTVPKDAKKKRNPECVFIYQKLE